MKKVTITGVREARIVDVPTPHAVGDWVLVKVHAIPMCTEYKAFAAGQPTAHLGHEAAGEVVEVAQPGPVQVGDRVVAMPFYPCGRCALCRSGDFIYCQHAYDYESYAGTPEGQGTYNEYLLKPAWILGPIPDGVSYEHGSLAVCGLGPTFGAMDRMGVNAFDTLLITGMGPVGLGGAVNAAYRGTRLISVESIPYRAQKARELGVTAEAVWLEGALEGVEPSIMGIGPVPATISLMKKLNLNISDFDLIEANEAFAAQSIAVLRDLGIDSEKLNINGGAVALGHPIGASGARILVTLIHEMKRQSDTKLGLATLCIGGGMGAAAAIEILRD